MGTASKKQTQKAPRNRTIGLAPNEVDGLRKSLVFDCERVNLSAVGGRIVCGDAFNVLGRLSHSSFDLLFADPPYNLTKAFGKETFRTRTADEYEAWLDSWLS